MDIARLLQRRFQPGKRYTEPEVNRILEQVHPDYASLRRYMVDYGFMERLDDGSSYWVEPVKDDESQEKGKKSMNREKRKELVAAYMETERPMGVYRITNRRNGKMWIGSSPDLDAIAKRHQFELNMGMFRSKAMQHDYNEVGEAEFQFEVLERLKQRKDGYQDVRHELAFGSQMDGTAAALRRAGVPRRAEAGQKSGLMGPMCFDDKELNGLFCAADLELLLKNN
ncbi:hypothetical protein SAMN05421868_106204 [Paenibacillus naphthalenovorans]|nr:hypothetical protein SAMN05421868_106204 [Paenibacillus naphthalenovorans]